MTNDEAKFILRGYRPSGRDAQETMFAEALEQSRRDPALGEWFGREQAFDQVVGGKLNEIMPPADLRERILAGGKVSQGSAPQRRHWGRWLALAASVAVIFALSEVWQGRRLSATQVNYAEFAVNDMRGGGHHPPEGVGMDALLKRLASHDTKLPGALGVDLSDLKAGGCRTIDYGERQAVELCFSRDGSWYHLYLMPRGGGIGPLLKRRPATYEIDDTAVAVWADGDYDYALVSPKGMAALQRLKG